MTGRRSTKGRGSSSPVLVPVGGRGDPLDRLCAPAVERMIAVIAGLDLDQLRTEWMTRFGTPAPRCRSKEVIRGLLASRIQTETYGGTSPDTARRLRRLAESLERDIRAGNGASNKERIRARTAAVLKPGTMLTREWRGTLHKVQVLDHGFAHAGSTYRSLSEIARSITGTHWSGPRFFGLTGEQGAARAAARVAS